MVKAPMHLGFIAQRDILDKMGQIMQINRFRSKRRLLSAAIYLNSTTTNGSQVFTHPTPGKGTASQPLGLSVCQFQLLQPLPCSSVGNVTVAITAPLSVTAAVIDGEC